MRTAAAIAAATATITKTTITVYLGYMPFVVVHPSIRTFLVTPPVCIMYDLLALSMALEESVQGMGVGYPHTLNRLGQISEKESLVGIFEEKGTNNFF